MKKMMLCLCVLGVYAVANGKAVDVNTAQTVAYNFLKGKANLKSSADLSPVYTATSVLNNVSVTDFYVFNAVSGQGFVIVSADDNVMPVLGYSTESGFTTTRMSPSFQYMLDNYKNQVAYVIGNNKNGSASVTSRWAGLKSGSSDTRAARTTTTTVAPMLPTKWDQESESYSATPYTYNADCPYDSSATPAGQTLTGCVATAMSQVMKYWNWPDTGVGANTYTQTPNPDHIPAQTANFAIAYHFDSMQTPVVTTPNAYVARLMYFAGVSVNMNYGTDAEDGSGAYVTSGSSPVTNCAEYALKTYFKYPGVTGIQRNHFTETEWVDTMLNEMNSGRPVIYAGQGNEGGHCWVMDGYDDDSMFHFNWGWSGYYNGYFTVNNLTPDYDTFNSRQEAITRIVADTPAHAVDTVVRTGVTIVSPAAGAIRVFPNPAANTINISFEGIAVKEIMISDIEGREVMQMTIANAADNITVPVSDLPNGIYLLRLQTGQGILTRKFVVAK